MGIISGNATVKPCVLFYGVGCISCMNGAKHAVNACMGLYCSGAKIKAPHPQQMQGKRKTPPVWAGLRIMHFDKVK